MYSNNWSEAFFLFILFASSAMKFIRASCQIRSLQQNVTILNNVYSECYFFIYLIIHDNNYRKEIDIRKINALGVTKGVNATNTPVMHQFPV